MAFDFNQWLGAYAQEHGHNVGEGNDETPQEAVANLLWSQEFAQANGRPPSQREWESHYYREQKRGTDDWKNYLDMAAATIDVLAGGQGSATSAPSSPTASVVPQRRAIPTTNVPSMQGGRAVPGGAISPSTYYTPSTSSPSASTNPFAAVKAAQQGTAGVLQGMKNMIGLGNWRSAPSAPASSAPRIPPSGIDTRYYVPLPPSGAPYQPPYVDLKKKQ